jgi:hypothetical protein
MVSAVAGIEKPVSCSTLKLVLAHADKNDISKASNNPGLHRNSFIKSGTFWYFTDEIET